jgi:hypothetical protein
MMDGFTAFSLPIRLKFPITNERAESQAKEKFKNNDVEISINVFFSIFFHVTIFLAKKSFPM